jgi:hypothetical protein
VVKNNLQPVRYFVTLTALLINHHTKENRDMQKFFHTQSSLAVICLPLLIIGCASEPVSVAKPEPEQIISGETMLRESQGIASLGERWKSGKQLVERGNTMVNEGEAKIEEGNRLISEGNKIIRESEEHYKNIKK